MSRYIASSADENLATGTVGLVTVMISRENWANPRFRRGYWILLLCLAAVLGLICTQALPSGTIEICTVRSTENLGSAFGSVRIESSCGTFVSFGNIALSLRTGSAYDFHMRGFIVRYLDAYTTLTSPVSD